MRIAAGVITAIVVAFVAAPRAFAADPPVAAPAHYTVMPHDTLYSIARRFGLSVTALARFNGLTDPSKLRAGTVLSIPAPAAVLARTLTPSPVPVRPPVASSRSVSALGFPGPAPVQSDAWTSHVVQPGDTVYHLAVTHGLTVAALEAANHLSSDRIAAGQVLRIPGAAAPATPGLAPEGRSPLPQSRPRNPDLGRRLSAAATRYLGTPYVWGGAGPSGVDCSGLVYLVYAPNLPQMPRSSYDQWRMGEAVARDDLAPGDLVFFNTDGSGASHVGIYIGGGRFVHPAASAGRVVIDRLDDPYYRTHYLGARRVL